MKEEEVFCVWQLGIEQAFTQAVVRVHRGLNSYVANYNLGPPLPATYIKKADINNIMILDIPYKGDDLSQVILLGQQFLSSKKIKP